MQDFISDISFAGNAAKICGAGSLTGDAAGMVLIAGNQYALFDSASEYGYEILQVNTDNEGTVRCE